MNIASSSEQSVNEMPKRNSRKSDSVKNCKDENSSMGTNIDEDANISGSNDSGIMFVSDSKDCMHHCQHGHGISRNSWSGQ